MMHRQRWEQAQRLTLGRQWSQAALLYRQLLASDPAFLPAWLELAKAEDKQGNYRAARDAALQASRLHGRMPPLAALAVSRLLRRFEFSGELRSYAARTLELQSLPADRLVEMAAFLSSAGHHGMALPYVELALLANPGLLSAHNFRGLLHMYAGENAAATACFQRCIAIDPAFGPAYATLAKVSPATSQDNRIDAIRRQLARRDLPDAMRVQFGYALHAELHDLGDHAAAWHALEAVHAVQNRLQPYAPDNHASALESLRRASLWRAAEPLPTQAERAPAFIIGLHRSGTTLLERILSGHPLVVDAGETYAFAAQLRVEADHGCPQVLDDAIAAQADAFDYAAIGARYRDAVAWQFGDGKRLLTEKLNPNFMVAGLIARALPEARLLHMQRDPIDTCFSNLRTLFTVEAGYSNDQLQMADFYALYRDWMALWREALPGRVLDVDYADLVQDPAAEARRVSAHCGLEFDAQMLALERPGGMVATASTHTVRKGVLTDRGRAWSPYAVQLQPLIDRLAAHDLLTP